METKKGFDHFAIVSLFGHQKIAGRVTEEQLFGTQMMRIDVPQTTRYPAFTRYIGGAAVYSIDPCTEEIATTTAEHLFVQPVNLLSLEEFRKINRGVEPDRSLPVSGDYDFGN